MGDRRRTRAAGDRDPGRPSWWLDLLGELHAARALLTVRAGVRDLRGSDVGCRQHVGVNDATHRRRGAMLGAGEWHRDARQGHPSRLSRSVSIVPRPRGLVQPGRLGDRRAGWQGGGGPAAREAWNPVRGLRPGAFIRCEANPRRGRALRTPRHLPPRSESRFAIPSEFRVGSFALGPASWHRDQDSVVGQLAEWEVWVELVVQSHGRLHVFLPLLDRGIDALVHRIDDGSWFPVQIKGRSQLRNGSLQIVAPAGALVDPDALLLGVALEDDHVGPFVLVITERDFKRIANRSHARGKPTFAAQVSLVPGRNSRL